MPSELVIGNPIAKKFEIYDDAVFALIEGSGDRESVVRARQGLLGAWRGQNRRIEDFITARAVTVNSEGELGEDTLSQLDGTQVSVGVVTAVTDNGATVRILDDDDDDDNDTIVQASQWFFPVSPIVGERILVARLDQTTWVIISTFTVDPPMVTHDDDSFTVRGPVNPAIEQWQYRYRQTGNDWTESGELDADTTTSTVSDLAAGVYEVEIRYDLLGGTEFGAWSPAVTIMLLEEGPDAPTISALNEQGFTVDAPDGTYAQWASRYREVSDSTWILSGNLESTQTTYVYAALSQADYEVQVRTRREATDAFSAWSSSAVVSVRVVVPDAPNVSAARGGYIVRRPIAGGVTINRYGWRDAVIDGGPWTVVGNGGWSGNRRINKVYHTDRTWYVQVRNEPVGLTPSDWSASSSVVVQGFVLPTSANHTITYNANARTVRCSVDFPTPGSRDLPITHFALRTLTLDPPGSAPPGTLTLPSALGAGLTPADSIAQYNLTTAQVAGYPFNSTITGWTIEFRHSSSLGTTTNTYTYTA